ncbi:Putative sialic acid transporter [Sulfuracidifex tepidarius]|uniref:Sialic acid transporter n=1 Tax=Sulfuracidifex tepidarius TaxID=1294262 RepID=A0A510DYT8_9CREN|nr:MFS transporter [Sulfuracidifex tepidarius]BBG25108.1 Putative sialic acid transporter [Sulfuracidifex tepidarius]
MNKLTISASMIGTIIEWYDVFIFSSAALYIGEELFPSTNPVVATLNVLLVFALGFITRPIGALIFGHFGDRRGRRYSLLYTLLISGISSGIVGLLPTYQEVGDITIVTLVILRLLLGLGLGGEWGGAVLLAIENGERKRGFYSSFVQSTVGIGLLMGSLIFLLLSSVLTKSEMFSFGWRIPFLLSFLMVAVGTVIRLKVNETALFTKVKEENLLLLLPSKEMFKKYWKELLLGTFVAGALGTIFYVGAILLPLFYETSMVISSVQSFEGTSVFAVVDIIMVFVGGRLSDRVGRRPILVIANLLALITIYPAFLLKSVDSFFLALVLFGIYHGSGYSPLAAMISEIFPTNVRYTGSSSAYQFGNSFLGGPASYVSADLGSVNYLLYPVYTVVLVIVTIAFLVKARESKEVEIST